MSLDVSLHIPGMTLTGTGIYIRENGSNREITRIEWDERFPNTEPVIIDNESRDVYSANITHNLGKMAGAAGIYEALWRPEEIGVTNAYQLVDLLRNGLAKLRENPEHFKMFNPENGWGNYDNLVTFVAGYLEACEKYPHAEVSASR